MHKLPEQAPLLQASLVPAPPCLLLSLRGELDLSSAEDLPRATYASRPDLTTVLVDLGGLTFCDLAGLRALLAFRQTHVALGRSVAIVRATSRVWRLMELCGITDRLEMVQPCGAAQPDEAAGVDRPAAVVKPPRPAVVHRPAGLHRPAEAAGVALV